MYRTSLPISPWENMMSFASNPTITFAMPAESRKFWTLKLAEIEFFIFFVVFMVLKPLLSWAGREVQMALFLIFSLHACVCRYVWPRIPAFGEFSQPPRRELSRNGCIFFASIVLPGHTVATFKRYGENLLAICGWRKQAIQRYISGTRHDQCADPVIGSKWEGLSLRYVFCCTLRIDCV